MAPSYSPSKTWEGAIAGGIAALVAGAVIGHQLSPWGGLRHGLELGLVVAVVAPIGDLVQSMLKRDLGVKDAGTLLPGHGGLLDRFDSLFFVLPAVYFLAIALHDRELSTAQGELRPLRHCPCCALAVLALGAQVPSAETLVAS